VFHRDDFRGAARPFPQYYDGKLFIYEFMRHWVMAVTMAPNGDFVSMERFMPNAKFSAPIEMEFAPNGDMYLLEYGTAWFQGNPDARLVRVEYNAGNRKPIVAAAVDQHAGALPLRVKLSSAGTLDLDEDSLRYAWTITDRNGRVVRRLNGANPSFTITQPGTYTASLTATDPHGASATARVPIAAGNEPPTVGVNLVSGNRTFFFPGVPVRYSVNVTDREDGSLGKGITAQSVSVTTQFLKEGLPSSGVAAAHETGKALIEGSDCLSCHQYYQKSIGPAYIDVARRYHDSTVTARLARKVREGGTGVWGRVVMPAHPTLTEAQSTAMVNYILSLADQRTTGASLPPSGTYVPPADYAAAPKGALVLRAEYTDRGGHDMPAITREGSIALRSPTMVVADGELSEGVSRQTVEGLPVEITVVNRSGGSVALKQLDLTGVSAVTFMALAPTQYQAIGGKIEVHLDSPTGSLLGESETIQPSANAQAPPSPLRVTLTPTTGVHDLYVVFRNPAATGDQFLFAVLTASFGSGASR
jgi:cytochrome c